MAGIEGLFRPLATMELVDRPKTIALIALLAPISGGVYLELTANGVIPWQIVKVSS